SVMNTASILDSATPAVPIGAIPLTRALLFGLASGLSLGAGLALLLEWLDHTVRRPDDIAAISDTPPLAVVDPTPPRDRERPARGQLLLRDGTRPAAEAFRMLRANIRLAPAGSNCKILLVTSAGDGEGKSFIACNLAIAFAQAHERVLLVDANLRSPAVQRAFGVTTEDSLLHALGSTDARRWREAATNGEHVRPHAERILRLSAAATAAGRVATSAP